MLAIISGPNGSGKSRLLSFVNNKIANSKNNILNIETTSAITQQNVNFVGSNFEPGDLHAKNTGTSSHEEGINWNFLEYARKGRGTNPFYDGVLDEIEKAIGKSIERTSDDELRRSIPADLNLRRANYINNQYISELFFRYQSKVDDFKISMFGQDTQNLTDEDVYNDIGYRPPWEIINNLFEQYNFAYRITRPRTNTAYSPMFHLAGVDADSVQFTELSDGEKIIVTLILWAYNSWLGAHNKLFLLDEIDAHLNPSMSRMLLDIIRGRIVQEFGIQVIMTTHSPSTAARARDDELFWLERGRPIRTTSRAEVVRVLADGIITVTQDEATLRFSTELGDDGVPALCVEGVWDKVILKKAWRRLFPEKEMPFQVFDMFGAPFIVTLFQQGEIFRNYPNKLFVGLIDFDNAYLTANGKLRAKWTRTDRKDVVVFSHVHNKAKISTLVLPAFRVDYVTTDLKICRLEMELMFPDDLIRPYCDLEPFPGDVQLLKFRDSMKEEFAARIIDDFPDEAYQAFSPLFDHIQSLLN